MRDNIMQKNRRSSVLSLKKFGAFVLWLQLTCILGGTLPDYLLNEFMPDSGVNLYHIAIHDTSGDIYVGGYNELFRLSDEFVLLYSNSTCLGEDCSNINKVLVIDYDNNRLITCGGGNDGECESRNLNDMELIDSSNDQIVGLGYLSAIGFIAPSSSGTNALYIASSDDGHSASFRFVSRRRLNDLDFISSDSSIQLIAGYNIKYTTGFSHNGFSYFVSNRAELFSTVYTSRLSRICQEWTSVNTFSEIHLSCSGYEYVQDMFVGPVGHDLADSLGLQPEAVVLYGVFLKSSSIADSAICIFTWSDIDLAFSRALEGCLLSPESNNELQYAQGNTCPDSLNGLTEAQIKRFMCDPLVNYKYFQGLQTEAASSLPVLELSSNNLTAITTVVEGNHTIAFLGTDHGQLIKAHIVNNETSRVYENFTVDSSSVRSDLLLSDELTKLTVLTEKKVLQLRVENCAQYTTCDECIGSTAEDGDPYCGWCTLENKCSRQPDCASTWLPYNNAACASILSVEPPSLLYTLGEQTLTLNIQELPPVTGKSYYECDFNNGAHKSRLQIGASNTCTSPPVDKIPDIPAGEDHVDIELAIFSSETGIKLFITNFSYYNCDAMNLCSECVNSPWAACMWCIGDNVCKSGQCMQNDVLVEHQNQTYCPQIITDTESESELVPVNFPKQIIIETRNLPKGKAYVCSIEIEGEMMQIPADLDEDSVYCNSKMYDYNRNVKEVSVAMRILWDGNIIDNEYILVLYKCAVNRPDCSRCLSVNVTEVELECVWCEDSRCTYNGSCNALSDVCGAPEVTEVTPPTLATSTSTRQVITVTGKDLGCDANNILNITVNNQICDIVEGSFNVSDQSVMCGAPACNAVDSCGEAPVTVYSNAGVSNTFREFTYQNPIITDFTPKKGIMSGGTRISIIGELLMTGSSQQVKIGDANCEDISVTNTNINCTTTSSRVSGEMSLTVYFGSVSRTSSQIFRVTSDPNVTSITQSTSICSGGRQLEIIGTNFDAVQIVEISVSFEGSTSPRNNCALSRNDRVICYTPKFPGDVCPTSCDDGQPVDMQIFFDGYTYSHNHGDNTFKYTTNPNYYMFTNTDYYNLKDGSLELTNRELILQGDSLNCASERNEVEVLVGDKICDISALSRTILICTTSQDSFSNDLVRVYYGNFKISLGSLKSPAQILPLEVLGAIVAVVILIVVLILGYCVYRYKLTNALERSQPVSNISTDFRSNAEPMYDDIKPHFPPKVAENNGGYMELTEQETDNDGGYLKPIMQATDNNDGGYIEPIMQETDNDGGYLKPIMQVTDNNDGGYIEPIMQETDNDGGYLTPMMSVADNAGLDVEPIPPEPTQPNEAPYETCL